MELRKRVRYRLSADSMFAWEGAEHSRLQGKGLTRDISLTGAFIFTSTCPPVGATVQIEVFLSSGLGSGGKKVRISTDATVVRVDHTANSDGFAAVSQDFRLLFGNRGRNNLCISRAERGHKGTANA
jgi:hypothetical protein